MEDRRLYFCQKVTFITLNIVVTTIGIYFVVSGNFHDRFESGLALIGMIASTCGELLIRWSRLTDRFTNRTSGAFGFLSGCFESYKMLFTYATIFVIGFVIELYVIVANGLLITFQKLDRELQVKLGFMVVIIGLQFALELIALRTAFVIRKERMYYDRY